MIGNIEYRNARYINEIGWIDCEINHPEHGWIDYTLDPQDEGAMIDNNDLLARMLDSNDVGAYVPPTQEEIEAEAALRARYQRDGKLQLEVDPIVSNPLRWGDLTTNKQQEWANYRLALLDVPHQSGFPLDINWPTKPK